MWEKIADGIIRYRAYLFAGITLITLVMGYFATKVEMSYDLPRTVPLDDPDMIFYQDFKNQFGEDGNMIAIAMKDSSLYQLKNFMRFRQLSNEIRSIEGIQEVLSLPLARIALKDTVNKRFVPVYLFPETISTQAELDSLLNIANGQKFQINQLSNTTNGATRLIAPMRKEYANSAKRIGVVDKMRAYGDSFVKDTGIQLHFAGLPFVRTVMATQVKSELSMFLGLSALVTV